MTGRPRVYDGDIDALQQRLRSLLEAGDSASEQDVIGYETERDRVLDLIGDQMREQRDYDTRMQRLRAAMEQGDRRDGAEDGWFSSGLDTAHQQHLDDMARTNDENGSQGAGGTDGYPILPGTARYDDALRYGNDLRDAEMATEFRRVEDLINTPYRDDAHDADRDRDDSEFSDRDRVLAEAPASQVGGMWFTPDDTAAGGVRPLTETELRAITERVRATQAEAVADDIARDVEDDQRPTVHGSDFTDGAGDGTARDDGRGWER